MDNIIKLILNFIVSILTQIMNIITTPIMSLIRANIPNFNSYFSTVTNFINNYIIKGIKFGKMAIVNTLQIDHNIFNICILIFGMSFTVFFLTRYFKLVSNLWSLKDNGKSAK